MSGSRRTSDYEEAVGYVELAMDDHHDAQKNLRKAESRVASKALFAQAVAEGAYNANQDLAEDYEEFANIITDYLQPDREGMDERAMKLAEIEGLLDEKINEGQGGSWGRRGFLAAVLGTAFGGAYFGSQGGNDRRPVSGGGAGYDGGDDGSGGSSQPIAELDIPELVNYAQNDNDIGPDYNGNDDEINLIGEQLKDVSCPDIARFGGALFSTVEPEKESGPDSGDYRLKRWEINPSEIDAAINSELREAAENSDLHGMMYLTDSGGMLQDDAYVGLSQSEYEDVLELENQVGRYLDGEYDTDNVDWVNPCE